MIIGIRESEVFALKNFPLHGVKPAEIRVTTLKKIIKEERVQTVFQPVIDLHTNRITAYEAFSRFPNKSGFQNPKEMFTVARQNDLVVELDRLCLKKALERAREIGLPLLLFVNVEPESAFDTRFWEIFAANQQELELLLKKTVLEVTRDSADLSIFLFLRAIECWRNQGFKISIDGIGTGYESLQLIGETKPNFIKIDPSLIRDIDEKEAKKELLRMFAIFADTLGVKLIAEGIETIAEFKALRDVGVGLGQGYLIRPPHSKPSRIISIMT